MKQTFVPWLRNHYIGLLVTIGLLIAFLIADPITRDASHFNRMIIAALAVLLLVCHFILRRMDKHFSFSPKNRKATTAEQIFYTVAMILCLFGSINYYQFDRAVFLGSGDFADATYYYLNSKYFHELGYHELYPAMLLADEEASHRLRHIKTYRDLYTYEITQRDSIYTSEVKYAFSPEQWRSFKHDVDFFVSHTVSGGWSYFFSDHGYNAPPTWTLIGGTLSRIIPVERIKWITALDFVLVVIMFVFVGRIFGMDALIYSLLLFLVTFSGRWPILGQALLRFDWLAALVIAMCLLKKARYGPAGALIMYATLSRVFPVLFFIPYFFHIIFNTGRNIKFQRFAQSFTTSAAVVFLVIVLFALLFLGWSSFVAATENLLMHSHSYSSHRVGLADALLFRFETTRAEIKEHGGITGKKEAIRKLKPLLYGLGILYIAIIGWVVYRRKDAGYAMFASAVPLIFIIQNLQINYYNMRIILVIYHLLDINKTRNKAGLVMLFLIEVLAQWTKVAGFERYTTTSATSVGLLLYFIIICSLLLLDYLRPGQKPAA